MEILFLRDQVQVMGANKLIKRVLGFFGLILSVLSVVSPAQASDFSIHGSLSDRYRLRHGAGVNDQRMETLLTLDFGDARADRFTGALQAGGVFRLNKNANSTFSNSYDNLGRAVPRLYYAYFDAKDLGAVKSLRFGRQHRYEFESLYYDGLTLEMAPFHHLVLTAFGGVPVHLFETEFGFDPGDWMLGGALQWTPVYNFQARFDVVHLNDEVEAFRVSVGDQDDTLLGTTFWWDIDPHVGLMGKFTAFSDQVRDVSGEVSFRLPEKNFYLRLNFYRLLQGYAIRVIDLDAFAVAGTYQPYTEFSFSATKGIGKHVALDGGLSLRFLDDFQVASAFNHSYKRFYLSVSTFDLPIQGLTLTATGDYYHGESNTLKNNTFGTSFTATQKLFDEKLKLTGGTAFYLYRYNLLAGNEASDVRTYFTRVDGKILKNLTARAGYEFEDNPVSHFHTVDLRLIWSF